MPDRKTGHLIENKINFRYDRVILQDMRTRGYPALTVEQLIEVAGSKRMATSMTRRGLIAETPDGLLRASKVAQAFADMWHARETKKLRAAEGVIDVVVVHPAGGAKDFVLFHPRTAFGKLLVDMHPLTSGKEPIEAALAADVVVHMRSDGGIVENRARPSYRGSKPTQLLVEEVAAA